MKFLVTGGAGYIGSITNSYLRGLGHETVIFDSLQRGYREAIGDTPLIVGDLKNPLDIHRAFEGQHFDAVIHFAAYALAGESMLEPAMYFHNNVDGGVNLLEAMRTHDVKSIIFSSTCAVYGFPASLPVVEEMPINPVSVYGASKAMFETTLDWYGKVHGIKSVRLRYFNACGALPDGSLGEDHVPETHIIPVAIRAAQSEHPVFNVFGTDYDTKDGTCVRDYIHVLDLADAHLKAAEYLKNHDGPLAVNLGVGKGYSNLEILKTIGKVCGTVIDVVDKPRRPGDPDMIFADNRKAREVLGWAPQFTSIESIIESAWEWHKRHPEGYRKAIGE